MDQVTVYVAVFASQVHSFDISIESCMHRVAPRKEKEWGEKEGKPDINTIVMIYSTGYFLKEKHQRT
jgi:hypothetical protein